MAGSPYIHERQSEYWTSRAIEDYFLDLGFEVLTLPIPQNIEKMIPADFIFFDKQRTKLFGLQYKALYKERRDYWPINKEQHQQITHYKWIYYCLSELKSSAEHRTALHQVRIVDTGFEFQELRWSRFDGHEILLAESSNLYEKNISKIYRQQDLQNPSQV